MPRIRPAWTIFIAVILIVAGVEPLRDQARLQWADLSRIRGTRPFGPPEDPIDPDLARKHLGPYQQRCARFVEEHHPDDPEMLMAVGILAEDVSLLKRAAAEGGGPAAWAAYAELLIRDGPSYNRVGASGTDPEDQETLAAEQQRIAESDLPTKLTPEEAAPLLDALYAWEAADPDNALPVALEVGYLYGLHRDDECLTRWEHAAGLPAINEHSVERTHAVTRLLSAMGMPEPEAIVASWSTMIFPSFARLRICARIAVYEGRLAQIEGRAEHAIRWWDSSISLGRHMQESPDTAIGFLVGVAIHGIGAVPVWRWHPDQISGIPDGPLFNGRIFYGPQYDFYVSHAGAQAAEEIRDSLVRAKVRSQMMRDHTGTYGLFDDYYQANRVLGLGQLIGVALALALLLFLAVGTWRRRIADGATGLRCGWQIAIAALAMLPLAAGAMAAARAPVGPTSPSPDLAVALFAGGLVLTLFAVPLLPLAVVPFSRRPSAPDRTTWRGNLRRILPITLALGALLYLGISLTAMTMRARWVREVTKPGVTTMSWLIEQVGDAWHNPTIPPDAYRAEYPPERPPEGP